MCNNWEQVFKVPPVAWSTVSFLQYPEMRIAPYEGQLFGEKVAVRTQQSTLANLLQASESCGSGASSTGNSQNECQNDLAVRSLP